MAKTALQPGKIEKFASGSLRFLFAPQLGVSLKPSKGLLAGFVQMLAQFLATARLIPATHRSLRPLTPSDARLGEVLALAYANVRKPGVKLDQIAVFGAVSALMALTVLVLANTIAHLVIGSANAGISLIVTIAVCTLGGGGGGTSYFIAPCATDMAQEWIDMLFFGVTNVWSAQVMSLPLARGMEAMFQTYSYAMLIVAGFLVLYHILAIIAGTAHEGRLGGKVMNQIWAPIRLVMAIGLLVPIGVNGLNSGQMIVLYVSKWGSALASNIWMNFATTFATQTGLFIIAPPLPQVSPTLKEALKIMTCAAGYNDLGVKSNGDFDILVQGWYSSGPNIKKSWDWQNNLSSKDIETVACGSVELPDPAYAAGGKSFAFFGTDTVLTASQQLRQDLLTAHRDALDDLMTIGSATAPKCAAGGGSTGGTVTGGLIYQLANKIYWSADSGNTCYVLTQADLELFNDAVTDYRTAISGATSAALGVGGLDAAAMAADAAVRGWLSAGVWFNTIARVNGLLIDYAQEVPVTKPNFKTLVDTVYANTIINAMESVDASIASLSVLASVSGTAMAETGFYVATGGGGAGNSVLDIYLKTLAGNFAYILGNMTNSPWESATGSSASAFMLNTANPLAELTTLGFRIIDLAMRTSNAVNQCVNEVNNEANALKSEGSGLTGNEYGFNSSCLGASYIGTVPTETLLMQAAIGSMISGGVTLAFLLPLLPFIRFMFGILSWVLSLFETVIAIPVVALAHIKPDGEGLSGPLARTAYLLLLQLFLRPTLMIFGLVLALVLFNLMVLALNEFYTMAVRGVENSGKLGAISAVVYTVIYAAMAYALANASFKAIDLVPNQTLQWIGGPNGQTIDESQRISGVLSQATGIAHHGLSGMGAKAALGGPKAV